MRTKLLFIAALAHTCLASPLAITLQGTLQRSGGPATVFDNQPYSVTFTIPDPALPVSGSVSPDLASRSVLYLTLGTLNVPGIGLSVTSPLQVQFIQDSSPALTFHQWMNIFQFQPLPVGDFMLLTPMYTIDGSPIWNGLADGLGTPSLSLLSAKQVYTLWRLQQIPGPGLPSLPLAGFESRADSLTISAIPEPSTLALTFLGLLAIGQRFFFSFKASRAFTSFFTKAAGSGLPSGNCTPPLDTL
ncbi:MAG: PEP-CTERM sorting domain-containing protein [Bryobacteraceae bacterium]